MILFTTTFHEHGTPVHASRFWFSRWSRLAARSVRPKAQSLVCLLHRDFDDTYFRACNRRGNREHCVRLRKRKPLKLILRRSLWEDHGSPWSCRCVSRRSSCCYWHDEGSFFTRWGRCPILLLFRSSGTLISCAAARKVSEMFSNRRYCLIRDV